jgi:integrase
LGIFVSRRQSLTEKQLASLPRARRRYIQKDPEMRGHYVRVPPEGPIVFCAVARSPITHKAIWATLGNTSEINIVEARDRCREAIKRIRAGQPVIEPHPPAPETLAAIAANWLTRYVDRNKLRTSAELHRQVDKYIVPVLGDRPFIDIKRSDIALFLDAMEDKHGPPMADAILSTLRAMANWYASRDDNYTPPFTRNMRRTPPQDRRRDRILNDNEICKIWQAADDFNVVQFGAVVKLLLLTGQRLSKVQNLRWDDIDADGVWTIRTDAREKQNAGRLKLPQAAIAIINAQPRLVSSPYVFISRTGSNGYSKAAFDDRCGVADWRLHDLRRTARSLMSRAGVLSEHAERVLGHAIAGIEGVYNRYSFDAEKAAALERLAQLIQLIIDPRTDSVVPLVAS